jgi:hypothetical protein
VNLATAQVALKWLAALSYAALLIRMIRWRAVWRFPAFSLYLLLMAVYLPLWNADRLTHSATWAALLMASAYLMCIEAMMLATETVRHERAYLLGLATVVGYVSVYLGIHYFGLGLSMSDGLLTWYRVLRRHSATFLAVGCWGAALLLWRWTPPNLDPQVRNHGLILCAYTATFAIRALFPPRGSMRAWLIEGCASFGLQLVWLGMWAWNARNRTCARPKDAVSLLRGYV